MRLRFRICLAFVAGLLGACGAKSGALVDPVSEFDVCVLAPPEGGLVSIDLQATSRVDSADIALVIDASSSMEGEVDAIRTRLQSSIVPEIREQIPDSQFGVATFSDFPFLDYGAPSDKPFERLVPITDSIGDVQEALDGIITRNGNDAPESQIEAIYQVATGEGLGEYIPVARCPGGTVGGLCFRPEAVRIALLFTDEQFHNGPGGVNSYVGIAPSPHTFDETVQALNEIGLRVIGFDSAELIKTSSEHLRALAEATDARGAEGKPLVFRIGADGSDLGEGVVDAVRSFGENLRRDVRVESYDLNEDDGVDATALIQDVVLVRADPMASVEGLDQEQGVFRGVEAGTELYAQVSIDTAGVTRTRDRQSFPLRIVFAEETGALVGATSVEIVVPGIDGTGCFASVAPRDG